MYCKPTWMLAGLLCWPAAALAEATADHCTVLQRVAVDETQILTADRRQSLFRPYLGQCVDEALLKAMIGDLARFYLQQGYITTRPYLKPQDTRDGHIEISVMTGYVEAVVEAGSGSPSWRTKTAFAFQQGKPLNLRKLETALEMVNRPPSSEASFAIKPGSQAGASRILVKTRDSRPWRLNLGLTGRRQGDKDDAFLTLGAVVDNPLNINDILSFNLNGSRVQGEQQSSRAGEINYAFPIASYLLEFVASKFTYQQGVQGINERFLADGRATGLRTRLSKVLMRDQRQKVDGALSIYHKNSKNFLADQLIEVSSYKTTLLQMDLSHHWLQPWGSVTTTYSFYQGTDWFGARKDGFYGAQTGTPGQARLQFQKHSLTVNLDYQFAHSDYRWTSRAHVQRSGDELFSNDKLSVGSDYTVRGYPDGSLYGNNAWYFRNDLVRSWALNVQRDVLQSLSLSLGADYGQVRCETDNPLSCGPIAGSALGIGTQGRRLTSSLTVGWPLKKITAGFKRRPTVRMDMSWKF